MLYNVEGTKTNFSFRLGPSKRINETSLRATISLNILQNVEGIPSGKK